MKKYYLYLKRSNSQVKKVKNSYNIIYGVKYNENYYKNNQENNIIK